MSFVLVNGNNKSLQSTKEPIKSNSTISTNLDNKNPTVPTHPLIYLQKAMGNQAVQRLMRSDTSFDFAKIGIQSKLKVSQPGDAYEQEADSVAEEVTRMLAPGIITSTTILPQKEQEQISRKCSACEMNEEEEEEDKKLKISRKPSTISNFEASDKTGNEISNVRSSGGSPLDASTKEFMGPRFASYDFSNVRVHTDEMAARSAQSVNATAYTIGNDIVFDEGQYKPNTLEGRRLLAHELTHVIQQSDATTDTTIQRQAGMTSPGAPMSVAAPEAPILTPQTAAPDTGAKLVATPLAPREGAERAWFRGVLLADDREFMRGALWGLLAREGLKGADEWHLMLLGWRPVTVPPPVLPAHLGATGALRPRYPHEAMREEQNKEVQDRLVKRLGPLISELYLNDVRPKAVQFLKDFEEQAKKNLIQMLEAQEAQAKAEEIRYGITSETLKKVRVSPSGEGPRETWTEYETRYDMSRDSPPTKGLQTAAKLLLDRRREIAEMEKEKSSHVTLKRDPSDPKGKVLEADDQYYVIEKSIEDKKKKYDEFRTYLSAEYPVLAVFSEINKNTSDLQTIAEKGGGPDTAALIGQQIAEKLAKIEKVKKGLGTGDVNVWRLPKIVNVTAIQLGANADPTRAKLIEDNRQAEQPGFWQDIALFVLNIAALVLAAPTGGISLGVAAGVNLAVAAVHIQEHLMQEALTGTTFNKAQAISQEDPSLFWLALEIVGAFADVAGAAGAMIKSFRTLRRPVRAVALAKNAEELEAAEKAVREAAKDLKNVDEIVNSAKRIRQGEDEALRVAGASPGEIGELAKANRLADTEIIGKRLVTETGDITITKSGHIFSCASPCRIIRDKYSIVLAKDEKLMEKVRKLEMQAEEIAKSRKAAETAGDSKKLLEIDAQAQKLQENISQFETTLRANTPERIAFVKWIESLRSKNNLFQNLDNLALERILQKAPHVDQIKGQLLEELLVSRMSDKVAREAAAGGKALEAAGKAKSEIEFIPGHLIRDAEGQMFTDGVLAYREGDRIHIVAIFESKAGKSSAQKLKRAWKDIPRPADAAERQMWQQMNRGALENMHRTNPNLAKKIERWKQIRMEAIEELRETNPALSNKSSAFIEKNHEAEIDAVMEILPKSESGQARKSLERLVPGEGKSTTGIEIGVQNPDGSVTFKPAEVTGGSKSTKLVGVVPDDVKGRNLQKIAKEEKIQFELLKDFGVKEEDLRKAAESLAEAAQNSP